MEKIFYLCDGNVETCTRKSCYKTGGPCRHTSDSDHALTTENRRDFVRLGDSLFEKGPEEYE